MIITEKFARIAASHIEENLPSVCLIMPFNPKMSPKAEIRERLNASYEQIKKELDLRYPAKQSAATLKKLRTEISLLNHSAHTKSVCIFVSPREQQTYYFNIEVKRKIIIDQAFDIRDIIRNKSKDNHCLILMLNAGSSEIYLKGSQRTPKLISRLPGHGDPELWLRQTDSGLSILLNAYPYPLFVMGLPEKLDHFKKISLNTDMVMEYIPLDMAPVPAAAINKMLHPLIQDQDHILYLQALKQLRRADQGEKLAIGIREAHAMAGKINNRLLIVEKNYACQSVLEEKQDKASARIRDLVDETIEKALHAGANVQFIERKLPLRYANIALIYD
ncbi:MAG: hypothetical protein JNL51_18245 [Chitinophagaceae bacterium]|nr:hypothetical protein [Chitinophagaceae bacterium]